jgi:hypothetical protein
MIAPVKNLREAGPKLDRRRVLRTATHAGRDAERLPGETLSFNEDTTYQELSMLSIRWLGGGWGEGRLSLQGLTLTN